MRTFDLGNGHTIEVEKVTRGNNESYEVKFFEDGRLLSKDFYSKEAIEYDFDITL